MNTYIKNFPLIIVLCFLSSCKSEDDAQTYEKVFKSDNSIQCGSEGTALDVMAMELISIGIDVVCSQKGHDGLARPAVCDTGTGNINI